MFHEEEAYEGAALVGPLIAPDPGGLIPRAEFHEYIVRPELTEAGANYSPPSDIVRAPDGYGHPMDGPFATVWVRRDLDSARWWGGNQNETDWPDPTYSANLPAPMIPSDTTEHIGTWEEFMGGYPPITRNAPQSFGSQVPEFNPNMGMF